MHVDKLPSIVADQCLWPDSVMAQRPGGTVIGMDAIKQRRLGLSVTCHQGLHVGDCVPFYFCPRSIMLYVIHSANHPDLAYRGGQEPIVHLEADLNDAVAWAEAKKLRWAFSLSNAGATYAKFRSRLDQIGEISWEAVGATDFRLADVREGKQAEFLLERAFPWHLVERVGVYSEGTRFKVASALASAAHSPAIEMKRDWYY